MIAAAPHYAPAAQTLLACQSCGAALAVAPGAMTAVCPYCASPSIVARPPSADRPQPRFVLPFVLGREHALAATRAWIRSRSGFFAHSGLRSARVDDVRGVYAPAYLYGAIAHSDYAASIGENYTETETYTTTDSQGHTTTATRTVTRTEWRPLAGRHSTFVRDVLVTASRSIDNAVLESIEPYDLRALRRWTPAAIAGWAAEEPTISLAASADMARQEALAKIGRDLGAFMPGDSHSGLQYRSWLESEVVDLVLVPVWVLAVRYDPKKPLLRLVVNGQTGRAMGQVPKSTWKIVLAIVVPLVVVILVMTALFVLYEASS